MRAAFVVLVVAPVVSGRCAQGDVHFRAEAVQASARALPAHPSALVPITV